jgi:hypothetical protein
VQLLNKPNHETAVVLYGSSGASFTAKPCWLCCAQLDFSAHLHSNVLPSCLVWQTLRTSPMRRPRQAGMTLSTCPSRCSGTWWCQTWPHSELYRTYQEGQVGTEQGYVCVWSLHS